MKSCFFTVLLVLILTACNSIKIDTLKYKRSDSTILELGGVITEKNTFLFNSNITANGKPVFKEGLLLSMKKSDFSTKKLKKIVRASKKLKNKDTLDFQNKDKIIISLQIKDQVKVMEYLQAPNNTAIFNYIKNKPTTQIVTSVIGVISKEVFQNIEQAIEIFLKTSSKGVSRLQLRNNGKKEFIELSTNFELLAYQSNYFCWGLTNRKKVVLKDLAKHKCDCSKGTATKASKIVKNIYNVKL